DYNRTLTAIDGRLAFDRLPVDGIVRVEATDMEEPWVFDVQQFDRVKVGRNVPFVVTSQTNSPHRYLALSEGHFLSPVSMAISGFGGTEYPQGLRSSGNGAEYLIITHREFFDACAPLEAFVEQRDTIDVMRVDINNIYQEFAGGLFDPTAIRDFLAWAVSNWQTPPTTVLFVGDGDYDYRNIISNADKNWVPPYENGTECTDTWYSRFGTSYPQLVSGRLPVESTSQVNTYLENLISYESNPDYGPWRSRMVLVADDEYEDVGVVSWNTTHMIEAETFSREEAPQYMDIRKIYIGTYPTEFDPTTGARRKPKATNDLITAINEGTLVVSFIGHGNAHIWTHESVFVDSRDDKLINAGDRLPIYVAATCNWGYWDRPENLSFPEILVFRDGGSIGIVTATRKTYVNSNDRFSTAFFAEFFDRTQPHRLGESLMLAQISTTNSTSLSYHCLGDPNLRPALPNLNVVATTMNPDSLTAFAPAFIGGRIENAVGTPDPSWSGDVLLDVIGGTDTLVYTFHNIWLDSDHTIPKTLSWLKPKGHLFRGLVSADAGEFEANFIVPRDIMLGATGAQVKMYAFNEGGDGAGAKLQIPISTQVGNLNDGTPPEIEPWFDQKGWTSGGMTTSSPTLYVDLFDTNGINLTGDIGHDIVAVLDDETEIRLTDDFVYNRDSYSRGTVERRLYNLEPGRHTLEVWVWDIANNYARKEITFHVLAMSGTVVLNNVINWPNPFSKTTNFTFELSEPAEVTIKIFTPSGRLVKEIGPLQANAGFNYPGGTSSELRWNGWDRFGDPIANGVYLYKVVALGENGTRDETIGKLLRIR
ncbi:MAG: type IX secretion system sortase PorU, partial [bacterium]